MNIVKMPISYKCMLFILSVNLIYFLGYMGFYFFSSSMELYTLSGMQGNILSSIGFHSQGHPHLNLATFLLIFVIPFSLMLLSLVFALSKKPKIMLNLSLFWSIIFGGGWFSLLANALVAILLFLPSTARYYEALKFSSLGKTENA